MSQKGLIRGIKGEYIKILPDEEKKDIIVKMPGGLNFASTGDIIVYDIEKVDKELVFESEPFVTTDLTSETALRDTMIAIFTAYSKEQRKNILMVPVGKIMTLINELRQIAIATGFAGKRYETISEFLTDRSREYWLSDRKQIVGSILSAGVKIVGYAEISRLLRGWEMKNDRRLVHLLSLSNKEIDKSCTYSSVLYNKLLSNPLVNPWIDKEKALSILELTGKRFSRSKSKHARLVKEYSKKGKVLRKLYDLTCGRQGTRFSKETFDNYHDKYDLCEDLIKDGEIVEDGDYYYLREVHEIENYTAQYFIEALKADPLPKVLKRDALKQPCGSGYCLDNEQIAALELALDNNVCIITGQAGTGKTSLAGKLIEVIKSNNIAFAGTSFTGKSVNRMRECGVADAATMHMMMARSDDYDYIHLIIDEFSMVDLYLFYRFINIFRHRCRITIIGDPGQLQPLSWGNLFKQLISSECVPIAKLYKIYRTRTEDGEQDLIIENARRILYWKTKDEEDVREFDFIRGSNFHVSPGDTLSVRAIVQDFIKANVDLSQFIILSPYNEQLPIINRAVQLLYNRNSPYVSFDPVAGIWTYYPKYVFKQDEDCMSLLNCFHIGDKVMMRKNNYDIEVMNGTSGLVLDVNTSFIKVNFGSPEKTFNIPLARGYRKAAAETLDDNRPDRGSGDTNDLSLAFAISVHSSQGSEWDRGIYYINNDKSARNSSFLNKPMTYTAITRFKKEVFVVSTSRTAEESILNEARKTEEGLAEILQKHLPRNYKLPSDDEMMREMAAREAKLLEEMESAYNFGESSSCDDYSFDDF